MNSFLEVIMSRRSIRDFREGDIPDEDVEKILRAGIMAPSPANSQPWRFHVIKGKTKKRFVEILKNIEVIPPVEVAKTGKAVPPSWHQLLVKGMETVPVVVAVENPLGSLISFLATAASIENLLLATHSLGYGSVWLAFPPVLEAAKKVAEIHGEIVCVLPTGHPADRQKEYFDRTRKPLEEVTKYYN